jgi:cellulose synthase/poly-beta-1,6-N-acetylglucosamine synthase-like glycosyltransferase
MENRKNLKNPKHKSLPSITVTVPAYNEEKTLAKTIKSLLELDYPKNKLNIIIVDDGSTDDTYKIAKSFSKQGIKVFRKENQGKAAALNLALKNCKTEFFGALDADSFVDKNALKNMIGYFENKKIIAVTPSLKIYNPRTFLQKIQRIEYLIGIFLRKIFAFLGSIHVTPGPFTIYRKKFFDKYGNYDCNNLTEDIEVALRIQSNKFMIENSVDAVVYTVGPKNFRTLLKQRIRWYMGFIENVIDYKHLFSAKYGNLGLFILPVSFISVGLVIITLFYTLIRTLSKSVQNLINYNSINFDLSQLFKFNFDMFYVNVGSLMFLSILTLMFGIMIIYFAKRISKENMPIKFHYIFYLVIYWALFGFWWITASAYKLLGKRIEWGQRTL